MRQHGVRQQGVRQQGVEQKGVTPLHVSDYLAGLLKERGVGAEQVAAATDLLPELIGSLLRGEQILTADLALSLAAFFELPPLLLLEVQSRYCTEIRDQELLRPTLAA